MADGPGLEDLVQALFRGLLADEFIEAFLDVATTIQDVQLLEGLEPGEYSSGYYTFWGLNLNKLAPETLPAEGDLRAVPQEKGAKFVHLVKEGSSDQQGDYTSERCTPALERLASLRSKIEHAIEKLRVLKDNLPAGKDSHVWDEFVLLPLRVTTRFLQTRILLMQSYLTYILMRERVVQVLDTSVDTAEGEALCRQALEAQDEYIRLRPGFAEDYPWEVDPDTLRSLVRWWKKLGREPQLFRDLDICAFLDRMETETGE